VALEGRFSCPVLEGTKHSLMLVDSYYANYRHTTTQHLKTEMQEEPSKDNFLQNKYFLQRLKNV
jgi:hypothetical protein